MREGHLRCMKFLMLQTESILNNGTEEGGYRMKINDIL